MNGQISLRRGITALTLLLVIVLSIFVVAPVASKPETYKETIRMLNEKQTTVLEMTAAASAASLALGAVPGDATTPIANKVIDMAGYFIAILTVIVLEKYMLTIAGYLTFTWLIPIGCTLLILYLFINIRVLRHLAVKVLALGAAIVLLVPVSVRLTNVIEKTNEVSINTSMENVKKIEEETTEDIWKSSEEEKPIIDQEALEEEDKGLLDYLSDMREGVNDLMEDTKESLNEAASAATQLSEEIVEKAKDTINDFIEVVVVMLVTTCGIPILTVLLFVWIIKAFLGLDFNRDFKIDSWRQKE